MKVVKKRVHFFVGVVSAGMFVMDDSLYSSTRGRVVKR